jgi:hypothetical protein
VHQPKRRENSSGATRASKRAKNRREQTQHRFEFSESGSVVTAESGADRLTTRAKPKVSVERQRLQPKEELDLPARAETGLGFTDVDDGLEAVEVASKVILRRI